MDICKQSTYRNMGVPWPPEPSISVDGRNAGVYPANPELLDSPSADSLVEQSSPSVFVSA